MYRDSTDADPRGLAGARCFCVDTLTRQDLIALSEDAAKVSGISHIMKAMKAEAESILDS